MKKIIILGITLTLSILTQPTFGATIKVEPVSTQTEKVTVNVLIEDVKNLGGAEFGLFFNPSALMVESGGDITEGDLLNGDGGNVTVLKPIIDNQAGKITFGAFGYGNSAGLSGNGTLATITFTHKGEGGGRFPVASG